MGALRFILPSCGSWVHFGTFANLQTNCRGFVCHLGLSRDCDCCSVFHLSPSSGCLRLKASFPRSDCLPLSLLLLVITFFLLLAYFSLCLVALLLCRILLSSHHLCQIHHAHACRLALFYLYDRVLQRHIRAASDRARHLLRSGLQSSYLWF